MKRFLVGVFIAGMALTIARAQDSGTQQQIDQLRGSLQDVLEGQRLMAKRLDALEKEVNDLRDKSSGGTGASQEDLQKLADQIQEIDKKRQDDRELILKEIGKLGKVGTSSGRKGSPVVSTTPADNSGGTGTGGQKGYDYTIQRGDTLMAISKAYRDQGIKVTTEQILKANPGLDPRNLIVGKKIFIPAPAQ